MTIQNPKYDYESYEKTLKLISDLAEKDYWHQYTTINSHQVGVAKTYLWISAALLGFYVAAFDRYSDMITTNGLTLILSFFSMSTVVIAFGLCIYAIPGRKGYKSIPNNRWIEF